MDTVKATDLAHNRPEQNDQTSPESNPCCFVMYAKCFQTVF
jgi:hypothetical protein